LGDKEAMGIEMMWTVRGRRALWLPDIYLEVDGRRHLYMEFVPILFRIHLDGLVMLVPYFEH
jgi:hypothetical protein